MPDLVRLDFATEDSVCVALPFGISFPTWPDAYVWLTGQGYEPQDKSNTLWARRI
jgi:hypothetical protein